MTSRRTRIHHPSRSKQDMNPERQLCRIILPSGSERNAPLQLTNNLWKLVVMLNKDETPLTAMSKFKFKFPQSGHVTHHVMRTDRRPKPLSLSLPPRRVLVLPLMTQNSLKKPKVTITFWTTSTRRKFIQTPPLCSSQRVPSHPSA